MRVNIELRTGPLFIFMRYTVAYIWELTGIKSGCCRSANQVRAIDEPRTGQHMRHYVA